MKPLTVLVIATLLATAVSTSDASAKTHRKHSVAGMHKSKATQPSEKPVTTRLPVPADMFRA